MTSGTMYSASLDSICEPGRGCRHWIRLDDLAQFVFLELHAPHQLAVVAAAEQVEVVGYQAQRFVQPGRGGRQLAQLQQQALAQVAGADAGGFQLLDAAQHDFHFVEFDVQFRIDGGEDFFEGLFEIAIVVDAIDDGHRDHPIGVRHRCQVDLPEQVAVQALAAAGARGEVPFVIVVAGQAAGAGLVDVFPGGIHRQLAGYAFAPLVVVEAFDAGRGAFLERALLGRAGRLFGAIGERVAVVEIVAVFLAFEHGIGFQRFLDFLLEVQGG